MRCFVGRFDVDADKIVVGQRGDTRSALRVVIRVEVASCAEDIDPSPAEEYADATNEIDGARFSAIASGSSVSGPTRRGSIWSGKTGKPTELVGSIWGGFPGGIALSSDEKNLVFSGLDQATSGSDTLTRFAIATPAMQTKQANAAAGKEAGGLHRAFNVDVYAFVDGQGTNGAGSIWALSKLAFSEE